MAPNPRVTGFARLTARQARTVLAVWVVGSGLFAAVTLSPLARGNIGRERRGEGDVALYRAEVDRIHAGEGYYHAAATELSARGYPTRSVFNWRTPLPMWLIGRMPALVLGKVLLGGLALALALLSFEALARDDRGAIRRPLAAVLLLSGPLMLCFLADLFVMPVLWAGTLIALSVCAFGLNRPRLGIGLGLAAAIFRELAVLYCVLAAVLAWRDKRRAELVAWGLGLTAWLGMFALHGHFVARWIAPQSLAHAEGWLQFGGAGFVIALAQMNAYLLLLPQWVAALYLAAALLGFAGWNTPLGLRAGLTVCLFLAAFAAVGHEFNQYWGSLVAPLLCLGVAQAPAALADLWRASRLTGRVEGKGAAVGLFRQGDAA